MQQLATVTSQSSKSSRHNSMLSFLTLDGKFLNTTYILPISILYSFYMSAIFILYSMYMVEIWWNYG